ncbi:MAG: hypothetical protein H7X88_12420 [Gloeobacteraceae cyanobacterium ES-bin-316]|nr:hypothetical protein [Ferruginibacter sp.]
MNHNLQKIGGWSAIVAALAYIIGFTVLIFFLSPENADSLTSAEKLRFMLDHKIIFQVWILIIYVVFGVVLVALTAAIHQRLQKHTLPALPIASSFGYIWAGMVIASGMIANIGLDAVSTIYPRDTEQATTIWLSVEAVHNGIGGGVEIVGGLWVLLISWFSLSFKEFSKGLHYLGFIVGIAGILTAIPGLGALGYVFGLLQIGWFGWIGIFMLKNQ